MTTQAHRRPVGRWSRCDLGRRQFNFLPVVNVDDAGGRSAIPLTVRYSLGTLRHREACSTGFDVFEFHRIEPALSYLRDHRPKNAFFHNDMEVLRSEAKADIRWRHFPAAYFMLENTVMHSLSSAWSVREPAVLSLRKRYPFLTEKINFTPTWVDPELFFPIQDSARRHMRATTEAAFGLNPAAFRIISVGRLDSQKDPELLLAAAGRLLAAGIHIELLFVGDGVLRTSLERQVDNEGLRRHVHFLGLRSPAEIAGLLHASDCFALSSAYEGMPMALLEALGTGTPVVTTRVGEVARVIKEGTNGHISPDRSPEALASSLLRVRDHASNYSSENCVESVKNFFPAQVLTPIYANYRALGTSSQRSQNSQSHRSAQWN